MAAYEEFIIYANTITYKEKEKKMGKKVGVITMHKVLNYGSALQSYALQYTIQKMGYDCELIDYIFPNKGNIIRPQKTIIQKLIGLYQKRFEKEKNIRFQAFYSLNFTLSSNTYTDSQELEQNPPLYDIYVTGSDQVWNTKNVGKDTSFLLSFAPKTARKIAYAPSFAMSEVPETYRENYIKYLSQYEAIAMREKLGCDIVKSLIGKDTNVVLDPTFLLNDKEWNILAKSSSIKIEEPYILVYVLDYAYNPYPYVTELIKKIKRQSGMRVVLLHFSNKQFVGWGNVTNLHDAVGPLEFLNLFSNASFIVTTSFHGVSFALNFSRPFYAIINNISTGDDRMLNILGLLGAEDRAIKKGDRIPDFSTEMDYSKIHPKLATYRSEAKKFLSDNLSS